MSVSMSNFPPSPETDHQVLVLSLHRIVHALADTLIEKAGPDSEFTLEFLDRIRIEANSAREPTKTEAGIVPGNHAVAADLDDFLKNLTWVNDARRTLANLENGVVEPRED